MKFRVQRVNRLVISALLIAVAILIVSCAGNDQTGPGAVQAPTVAAADGSSRVFTMNQDHRANIGNGNVQCASGRPVMRQTNSNGKDAIVFEANLPTGWTKATFVSSRFRNWPGDDMADNTKWIQKHTTSIANLGNGASTSAKLVEFEQGHWRTAVDAFCGGQPSAGGRSAPMQWSNGSTDPDAPPIEAPVCAIEPWTPNCVGYPEE